MFPEKLGRVFITAAMLALILGACVVAPAAPPEPAAATVAAPPTPVPTPAGPTPTPDPWGTKELIAFDSAALAGNLLGDPAVRDVYVWLPPSYYASDKRYPVVYMLHGYTDSSAGPVPIVSEPARTMIRDGRIGEVILVFPDAYNAFRGSWYLSSPTIGDYETYIARELVDYIDTHYRTLASAESRGITGHSMGSTGAMHLALKYPDVFGVVVAYAGLYDFDNATWKQWALDGMKAFEPDLAQFKMLGAWVEAYIAIAAGTASNPEKPPFYLDMPFAMVDGEAQIVPEVWARLVDADPVHDVARYLAQPERLGAILIVHATQDDVVPVEQAREFSALLDEQGIAHEYSEHGGVHETYNARTVLQFMSDHLAF